MDYKELLDKYADELEIIGELPADGLNVKPEPIRNYVVSAKQNYINWMKGEKPLYMPMPNHLLSFAPAIIPDTVARHYVIEMSKQSDFPDDGKDMFGIDWTFVPSAGGSMVKPGSPAVTDLDDWRDSIVLPDVASWDWEGSAKLNEPLKQDFFARKCWLFSGFFERLISWLDFEDAAVALIDEDYEESVHDALDAITKVYEEIIVRVKQAYDIDVMYVHDDWGSQMAPFFAEEVGREVLVPYIKRCVDITHANGMTYDMHSCGHIEDIVDLMIEAGVDSWCGQPMNNFDSMYEKYGDRIRLQIRSTPPTTADGEDDVALWCQNFLEKYERPGAWSMPFFKMPNMHPSVYPIMYAMSREYFATH